MRTARGNLGLPWFARQIGAVEALVLLVPVSASSSRAGLCAVEPLQDIGRVRTDELRQLLIPHALAAFAGMASHSLRSPSAELPGHLLADGFHGAVVYFSLTCGLLLASALAIALVAPPY
jgi:hypothetical protein